MNVTNINADQKDLFSKTIELYGDLSYLFRLIADNGFTGITETIAAGAPVAYDDALAFIEKTTVAPADVTATAKEKTYRIQENQTIFDVSLQLYGTIEGVFNILQRSTGIDNINQTNLRNINAVYTEQSSPIPKYYTKKGITVATQNRNTDEVLNRSFDLSFDLSFG